MHHHQQTLRDLESADQTSPAEILLYFVVLALGTMAAILFFFSF